jgi:hypothetical protein
MSTQTPSIQQPVNIPIYNIRTNILESTIKANQGATREIMAEQIFNKLKADGRIPEYMEFSDLEANLVSVIGDRDADGYYDVDMADINQVLPQPAADGEINNLATTIQSTPEFEAYFNDSVRISTPQRTGQQPNIAGMTYSQGMDYFRTTYGSGPWTAARVEQFRNEAQLFMNTHFTPARSSTMTKEEAADAVADDLPPMNDSLISQLSKDGQGRARVDCGVFAQIYGDVFRAAGIATEYSYLVMNTGNTGINRGGHMVVTGTIGKQTLIGNNEELQLVAAKDKAKEIVRGSRGLGGQVGRQYTGSTIEEARAKGSHAGDGIGMIDLFNIAHQKIDDRLRAICNYAFHTNAWITDPRNNSGVLVVVTEVNQTRADLRTQVNEAIKALNTMASEANDTSFFDYEEVHIEGREDITEFSQRAVTVLRLYRDAIGSGTGTVNLSAEQIDSLRLARDYFEMFNSEGERGEFRFFAMANLALDRLGAQ